MMKYATTNIQLNGIRFQGVRSVSVKRSINQINSTATITMPTAAVLRTGDTQQKVEVAEQIKRGDSVVISLGYDSDNKEEFRGYITRINQRTPLVVECEDNAYIFKKKNIKKTYKNTNLQTIIRDLCEDLIDADYEANDINIENLILATDTGEEVTRYLALERLKELLGIAIYFRADGSLYAGLHYTPNYGSVKHSLGVNTRDDGSELKYHKADEQKIKIKAIYIDESGEKTEVEVGDEDGGLRTVYFSEISSRAELSKLAENAIKQYRYDGYEGSYNAFLQPFCQPGYSVELIDEQFPERSGTYYIDAVTVELSQSGGVRKIEISQKL